MGRPHVHIRLFYELIKSLRSPTAIPARDKTAHIKRLTISHTCTHTWRCDGGRINFLVNALDKHIIIPDAAGRPPHSDTHTQPGGPLRTEAVRTR